MRRPIMSVIDLNTAAGACVDNALLESHATRSDGTRPGDTNDSADSHTNQGRRLEGPRDQRGGSGSRLWFIESQAFPNRTGGSATFFPSHRRLRRKR